MVRSRQAEKTAPKGVELRKQAGAWLQQRRKAVGLSQIELAERLGLKYYTFISQVENGFSRVPSDSMEAWAQALGIAPADFARHLLACYEPELHKLLFGGEPQSKSEVTS
jgi:transcriptional regulator with XRE-family HTH domain